MLKIIKQEINLNPTIRKKIEFASSYANIEAKVFNGHLIRLEPTNIAYVEPHKVIVNNKVFLFFNDLNSYYIDTLDNNYVFSTLQSKFLEAKEN